MYNRVNMTEPFNREHAINLLLQKQQSDLMFGWFYSLIPNIETLNTMTDREIELLFNEHIGYPSSDDDDVDSFYYESSSNVSIDSSASDDFSD